jgi:hypothetical protein
MVLGVASVLGITACGDDGGGATDAASSESSAGPTSDGGPTSSAETSAPAESESGSSGPADTTGEPPAGYDDPALWLCHADKALEDDQCLSADLDATEILPDGTTQLVEHVPAEDPAFDCFYVYPTVDIRLEPGQTEDFEDISQELDPLLSQAARLTSQCRVFAPLYHQVTLGTFGSAEAPELMDSAYQDVAAAFESYLANHGEGRDFVIMGHSQGTYMTTRLVQEIIEPDPDLLDRMIVALLIGGSVSVPLDETVGGTFPTVPLCTAVDELGCVLAYRTYAADFPPEPDNQNPDIPGNDVACTNPMIAARGPGRLAGAFFPLQTNQGVVFPPVDPGIEVDTPWVLYRDMYSSLCESDSDGLGFLSMSVKLDGQDMRTNPIDFGGTLFNPGFLGLHVLDYNFAMQDLLDQVAAKAAAKGL